MAHQSDNRYDLFIAYSDADRAWVNGFLLPALHVPTERVITSQKFRPGASLPGEFVEAVQASRYTVLVLSPSYLENEWTTFGGQLASYASVADNSKRLIPLHRYPCNLPLDIAFRVSLDCTDQNQHNWEQEIARLRDLLDLPEPVEEPIPCPYPGMRPFSSDEADLFFGRANEVEDLQRRLRHHNYFFIIGPSGSGKSSLVFAGLVPKLHKQQRGEWLVKSLRPGTNPLQALAKALGRPVEKVKELQSIADYTELVEAALVNSQPAQRFLLIIDQLEELFAQTEKLKQLAFIDALKCLRRIEKCVLILTMRADFYSDLMNSTLWPLDTIDRLEIAPLRGNNLQKAIVEPAEAQGVSLERDLLM